MHCEICHRPPSVRLPFNCALCAQSYAYQPRVDLALSLLERESIEEEVGRKVNNKPLSQKSTTAKRSPEPSPVWTIDRAAADQMVLDEKTAKVLGHVKGLREEIQHVKLEIAKRKASLARRRKETISARQELSRSQSTELEPIKKDIKRTLHRWENVHQQTMEQRLLHCTQAARLYSLQQHKRRKGTGGKDMYAIGFMPIPDLRELNSASPSHLTTSLTHVANFVHLVSHHLSLKLPAEITLPHTACPLATILSPNVSYTVNHPPSYGLAIVRSNVNPTASRQMQPGTTPRPRPLYLKQNLSTLAKDDLRAYAYFVEGITLLAWDIAWLCKTQGLDIGNGSWEEVCAMGKNLWQLLQASSGPPTLPKKISNQSIPQEAPISWTSSLTNHRRDVEEGKVPPPMGHLSHGTAYGFLGAGPGNEYMRDWPLQNPVKIIDKVKSMLLAERTGAEWEILEGNEWEEEDGEAQTKIAKQDRQPDKIEETGILVRAVEEGKRVIDGEDERGKGASGWTKVKSR